MEFLHILYDFLHVSNRVALATKALIWISKFPCSYLCFTNFIKTYIYETRLNIDVNFPFSLKSFSTKRAIYLSRIKSGACTPIITARNYFYSITVFCCISLRGMGWNMFLLFRNQLLYKWWEDWWWVWCWRVIDNFWFRWGEIYIF